MTTSAKPIHSVHEQNFRADINVEIEPTSPAGGVWTASVHPSTINPGEVTISVQGHGINASALTPEAHDVQIASVTLFARPAP